MTDLLSLTLAAIALIAEEAYFRRMRSRMAREPRAFDPWNGAFKGRDDKIKLLAKSTD